jgi:hypothetical protein
MGGAVGDYNNDGWPDIVLTCQEGLVLLRNNGNGTFTDVTKQARLTDSRWATGAAFADYDGDGFVDLMIARYVDFDPKNPPPFGIGPTCHYRGIPVQCGPRGMKGLADSLYHNNGDGTFTDVSTTARVDDPGHYYGLGVIWSDLNDDGRPDLFVANDSTPNYLYRNDGQGRFANVSFISGTAVNGEGAETAGMGIAVCDYDHSGRFSLIVTTFEDQAATLYHNDGAMNFTDVSFASGIAKPTIKFLKWGVGCEDFDNDGWPDIFIASGHVYPQVDSLTAGAKYRETKIVLRNNGKGSFQDVSDQAGAAISMLEASRGAAFGDLDNDGKIDVVIENIDGKPKILRNTSPDTNHWLTLRLAGRQRNRLAIGAKVKLSAGPNVQIGEVRSGGSYLSQNDLRLHFGLGRSTKVEKIEVRWPSGTTEVYRDVSARVIPPQKSIADRKTSMPVDTCFSFCSACAAQRTSLILRSQPFAVASVRKRFAGLCDSYAVIGVLVVHVRDFIFRHVASDTIYLADRTGGAGLFCGTFVGFGASMATEAPLVVGPSLSNKWLMRIVAPDAGQASISISPAAAAFQPVRLKSNVGNSGGPNPSCIPPGRVACAAEIYNVHWFQLFRIHDGG